VSHTSWGWFTSDKVAIPLRPGSKILSSMAEHSINLSHHILLNYSGILAKKSRCMDCIITEVTEIELHTNNMTREDGFPLSRSWKPLAVLFHCFGPWKGLFLFSAPIGLDCAQTLPPWLWLANLLFTGLILCLPYIIHQHSSPTQLNPEDGSNMILWNFGMHPQDYMTQLTFCSSVVLNSLHYTMKLTWYWSINDQKTANSVPVVCSCWRGPYQTAFIIKTVDVHLTSSKG
jgi:hypothetical protein